MLALAAPGASKSDDAKLKFTLNEQLIGQGLSPLDKGGTDAAWLNNLIATPGGTLRDVAIGTHVKGVAGVDDTVRIFTISSAAPRNVYMYTDISTVAPSVWRQDIIILEAGAGSPYGIAAGDVDGDGMDEVVYSGYTTTYAFKWADWNGSTWTIQAIATVAGSTQWDIAIGDGNNDGAAEVFAVTSGQILCYKLTALPNTWSTAVLYAGSAYGICVGNFDPTRAGNEVATCDGSLNIREFWWNGSIWTAGPIFSNAYGGYDLACGEFDPNNPGQEIAYLNYYSATVWGEVIEMTMPAGTWVATPRYIPASGTYGSYGEIAIGDFIGTAGYGGIVFTAGNVSSQATRACYWNGSSWVNEPIYTTTNTSYGVAVGNVNKWRSYNQEIANSIGAGGSIREIEQDPPVNHNVGVAYVSGPTFFANRRDWRVDLRVSNSGLFTETNFPVNCTLYDATSAALYNTTINIPTIAAGATKDTWIIVPKATYSVPIGVNYTVAARTVMTVPPDEQPANDRATLGSLSCYASQMAGGPDAGGYWWGWWYQKCEC